MYAALVFSNIEDVKKFREDYKIIMNEYFKNELKMYKGEIKGSHRIAYNKRKIIYNLIINSNCQLISVIEEKNKSVRLKEIEEDYKKQIEEFNDFPLKAKIGIKKIRKDKYGIHKTYLISEIICIICKQVLLFKKTHSFIIKSDIEQLSNPSNCTDIVDYMKNKHIFLRNFNYNYQFSMANSRKDYCLQGADFLAHAINKKYNQKNSKYFNYINEKKKIFFVKNRIKLKQKIILKL